MSFKDYCREQMNDLNEATTKGIPSDLSKRAEDISAVKQLFARDVKKIIEKSVDLNSCTFKDIKYKEVVRLVDMGSSRKLKGIGTPRIFIASSDFGDDDDSVAWVIVSEKTFWVNGCGSIWDQKVQEELQSEEELFKQFASSYVKEVILP